MVLKDLWYNLGGVTDAIVLGPQDPQRFSKLVPGLDGLLSELNTKRGFLEQLNADDLALRKTMAYEDQNIPSNETQMQLFYGLFEILQLVWTLCDQLDRKRKSAPFKAIVKNDTVKDLRDVTQKCYIMTQDLARAWIEHWKQHGQAIIKAQARYGETGQALRSLVADDELNVIARLYADSVIDTLGGVLQVRLFRK
jgi:N-terminal acetyltransferase B complex non-catalytic subunit